MKTAALLSVLLLAACGGGSGYVTGANAPDVSAAIASRAALHANPSSITFKSGKARRVVVTEAGYSGSFSERDTCDPFAGEIAAVTREAASAGKITYTVSPLGAGTCTITVLGSKSKSIRIAVKVTTAAITVQ
jgi:hypothetical protein